MLMVQFNYDNHGYDDDSNGYDDDDDCLCILVHECVLVHSHIYFISCIKHPLSLHSSFYTYAL